MIKKLKDFNELKLENNNIGNYFYLLSSDQHRDSITLDSGSLSIDGLKKLLIFEQEDLYGHKIYPETITIKDNGENGWLHFKYKDLWGDEDEGKWGFIKIKVV